MTRSQRFYVTVLLLGLMGCMQSFAAAEAKLELRQGDRIAYIGNTLADRMQHVAWLDTYLHALHPEHDLTIRNLGFAGDELKIRYREDNFGSADEWLTKVKASVIFAFFGRNEALRGEAGLESFRKDLADTIDGMLSQKYDGKSAPRLVFFSPIAHENLNDPHLPDGVESNKNLSLYTAAMKEVCAEKRVAFVDLFNPTQTLYEKSERPLTMNGVHLLDSGDREVAQVIVKDLLDVKELPANEAELERLRQAILEKNYYWFSRYRVIDGYNVFGGRSKLEWFGQSNADVMMREMEIFDVMTANRDKRVWAVARGGDLKVIDDNIPPELEVKTNIPGPLPDGKHPYLGGVEGMSRMTLAKGLEVNLYASEEMFPELINPVQMAVDPDGRLFVSVWPSYPHWNPTEPRRDRILCLPDDDGDGVADRCEIFADELNSVTGFEFWGGGMLVAALPEIWFLKDTDGDGKADFKLRMLQGVSSADSHHSANAMLLGPDGWIYWSRGIFNTASMETPTGVFRSGETGVYRFNPRTYEIEFHFPIGPNPHGDVFDQWGYQFANDATSGTGSYVNIGKGVGNKLWFEKRVRPVAATGILSSSHFPDNMQGNFLVCNTIGVLGVLQHEVRYNGADITAEEVEPILISNDPNFRPTDLEIGQDGALYVSDWSNAIIGHMQHNMRDPNRDNEHGRIYRVTAKGRPLVEPVRLKGKPIDEVLQAFYANENSTRYRARIELSGRKTSEVVEQITNWTAKLDIEKSDDAQAMLECLWVLEEHRVPNFELLQRVFKAEEPRVRAAAVRTLGNWGTRLVDWQQVLTAAAKDPSPLVRAEAVKSAVSFSGMPAAEVIFSVSKQTTDPELDTVLKYARGRLNVDQLVKDAIDAGQPLSPAARDFALANSNVDDLLKLPSSEDVYEAILGRTDASDAALQRALEGLAELRKSSIVPLLLELVESRDASGQASGLGTLGQLLASQPAAELKKSAAAIEKLALEGKSPAVRQLGFAAWIVADQSGDGAFLAASSKKENLRDVLFAVRMIRDKTLQEALYQPVRALVFELPPNLNREAEGALLHENGIVVDYFGTNPSNVALETLAGLKPNASGIVSDITLDVPQRAEPDGFALRFSGTLQVPKAGSYRFFTRSDDGSRLYINGQLVVNNDGLHGPVERTGNIELSAGGHALVVTYFDNGGDDALEVHWAGPDLAKQKLAPEYLTVSGRDENLHDIAIASLVSLSGKEGEKFSDLATVLKTGRQQAAAVQGLSRIAAEHWQEKDLPELVDNLLGYLSHVPAQQRTAGPAVEAAALVRAMAAKLPTDQTKAVEDRLQNLDVHIIAVGTVTERMIFDKEIIAVEAGRPVEFRFANTDNMPHNFTILVPGSLEEVGQLAEATARDADAKDRHYVPKSDKVLLASRLLEPGQSQALSFEVPKEPGIYPYVCTYPGHWRRMYGALYVVADLEQYQANPAGYLAANPLPMRDELLSYIGRDTEWALEDLVEDVRQLPHGRSFEVGKNLFRVANCVGCHKLNNEGQALGPDLAKLDEQKHTAEYLLESLIEPSKQIAEQYQSYAFLMESGKVITGMIVEETPSEVKVLIDPLAKGDPIVLATAEIEERKKSEVSIMPAGLLSKLTREEILDLIAYVYARGDQKHELFSEHHDHGNEHGHHDH